MATEIDQLLRPIPEGECWWSSLKRYPAKIMDQHFGCELYAADLEVPFRRCFSLPRSKDYIEETGYSKVYCDEDVFCIEFASEQFKVEDLKVVIRQNSVTISGKHSFVDEGEGSSFRSFERRYMLPVDACTYANVDYCHREDNILKITIPRNRRNASKLDV